MIKSRIKSVKISDMKTLTTAASSFLVWIFKNELTSFELIKNDTNLVLHVIKLSSNNGHNSLGINHYFNSVIKLNNLIEFLHTILVYVIHAISQAVASFFSQSDLNPNLIINLKNTIDGSFFLPINSLIRIFALSV